MKSPAIAPETADRALAKVREQFGHDADVACLLDRLDADVVRKVLCRKSRGGTSARYAAQLARRDEALGRLYAVLCPAVSAYAAACLLTRQFRRYESGRWLRERDDVIAPIAAEPVPTFWRLLRGYADGGPRFPKVTRLTAILESRLDPPSF